MTTNHLTWHAYSAVGMIGCVKGFKSYHEAYTFGRRAKKVRGAAGAVVRNYTVHNVSKSAFQELTK